jgi:hypothetical protein
MGSNTFSLIDGTRRNREHPETFEILPEEERSALVPGSVVRLGFEYGDGSGERMWVQVKAAQDGSYWGVLVNKPLQDDVGLCYGTPIDFGPEHVLAVYAQETAP